MCQSHACGLMKTLILHIKDNFSHLTLKCAHCSFHVLHVTLNLLPLKWHLKWSKVVKVILGNVWKCSESLCSDFFGNSGHDKTKISCIWVRKSCKVYFSCIIFNDNNNNNNNHYYTFYSLSFFSLANSLLSS